MKILLVTSQQYGYLTDFVKYAEWLHNQGHTVHFVCFDHGKTEIEDAFLSQICYVSKRGNKLVRANRLLKAIISLHRWQCYDRIMVNYFPLCSMLALFLPIDKTILDIRTVCVSPNPRERVVKNFLITIASKCFKYISIIGDSCAQYLRIKNYNIIPLGGDIVETKEDSLYKTFFPQGTPFTNFLYVGTFHNRRIIDLVKGFHIYLERNGWNIKGERLILIGSGYGTEYEEIMDYVQRHKLEYQVLVLGYVPQKELGIFYENCHFGISYVPITSYYAVQPSTKTYEYLVNGLPVIATRSKDNIDLIAFNIPINGRLIHDNSGSFANGVLRMIQHKQWYNRELIKTSSKPLLWKNVLDKYLPKALNFNI